MFGLSPSKALVLAMALPAALASCIPEMEGLPTGIEEPGAALLASSANGFTLVVEPATVTLAAVGERRTLSAKVLNRAGKEVQGWRPEWRSLDPTLLEIDAAGTVTGRATGTGRVAASVKGLEAQVTVTVNGSPSDLPPQSGDFVKFPSAAFEFIVGPQLRSGRGSNPWPWFDETAITMGDHFGSRFPATPAATDEYVLENYYDQALVQYANYFRTGDPRFREYARKIADSWWDFHGIAPTGGNFDNTFTPRNAALGGLMLRALDGRPEMWPEITAYTRYMFDIWVGLRLDDASLYLGVRDGGYMLLYAAWLGGVHPDAAVRAEFRELALRAARDYYVRLQRTDGSWRWKEDSADDPGGFFMQPLMVGLLLEGLIATHQLTGDPAVGDAIVRAANGLYNLAYRKDSFDLDGDGTVDGKWRGMWYFVYGIHCNPPQPGRCGETDPNGDANVIRESRQNNPLTLHAFGYAFKLSGNTKYRAYGDEIFSATFGSGRGPGADAWSSLAGWGERGKEYNQNYRTAGRYLAWRLRY